MSLIFFLGALSSLFTIVNPFSTAAIFPTITKGDSRKKKLEMARKASITAAVVLIIFALIGNYILSFFSITVEAFRIAGGILIASVGWRMLQSKREHLRSEAEKKEAIAKEDVSIIPLAIPMLSGPGAMTTVLVLMREAGSVTDKFGVIVASVIVCVTAYIILRQADRIYNYLGTTGTRIIERILGLIVMVVGVQFIINGLQSLIVSWF